MNSTQKILSFLITLLLFVSCTNKQHFSNRKYLPGFFKDRAGKKEIVASEKQKTVSDFETDSVRTEPTFKEEKPVAIVSEKKTTDSVPPSKERISAAEKSQNKSEKQISPAPTNSGTDDPVQETDELKKINLAFIFALIALFLFAITLFAALFASIAIYMSIGLLIALGFAIAGMVIARRIRFLHFKGEKYEGREKVIFARIIGIAGIVLTVAFLALIGLAIFALIYGGL